MTGNNNSITKLLAASEEAVSLMIGEITHICRDMKIRAPGSEGEREAAEYMAGVLKNSCGCKDVRIGTFKEHPSAFYGYFWFSMTFDVLCAILYFVCPRVEHSFRHPCAVAVSVSV